MPDLSGIRLVAFRKLALSGWAATFCLCLRAAADEATSENALPSFAELQTAGAMIGEIRVVNDNIFDLDDPKEDNFLFRLANKLHIRTRQSVIQRSLLFKSGDVLSVQKIEESERLLLANRYLYEVHIRPVAYHDGIVDIEVETRDTWSLEPGFHFSRAGGSNSTGLSVKEYNLLGTGISLGYAQSSDVDRNGTEFQISQNNAFDGWTQIGLTSAQYDGQAPVVQLRLAVLRPRHPLGGRRIRPARRTHRIHLPGWRHRRTIPPPAGHRRGIRRPWSKGLIDGWTQRYSAGLSY